jgi:hypothetical protein
MEHAYQTTLQNAEKLFLFKALCLKCTDAQIPHGVFSNMLSQIANRSNIHELQASSLD